ncbi:MAG TPA: permease prefix domain 1-containing protein [Segetibacter sp.]|jgi:hypothetical protein
MQSIDEYIDRIKSQGAITNSDAAELSAHLEDATSSLIQKGLSDQEAFMIASKRLGNEKVISEEYSKVNTTINTSKVWVYLLIGFNIIFSFSSLVYMCVGVFYLWVYQTFAG